MIARLPRYSLDRVQRLVAADRYRVTDSARRGAIELGLDESDIVERVAGLVPGHFTRPWNLSATRAPGRMSIGRH